MGAPLVDLAASEELNEPFCVLLLVCRRPRPRWRRSARSPPTWLRGEEVVPVSRQEFSGKGREDVLLGLDSFQALHSYSFQGYFFLGIDKQIGRFANASRRDKTKRSI